jgi:hypothetical protein
MRMRRSTSAEASRSEVAVAHWRLHAANLVRGGGSEEHRCRSGREASFHDVFRLLSLTLRARINLPDAFTWSFA